MVPDEILTYATSCRGAHLFNDFRMSIQMLKRRCDRVHISRLHNDSFDAIAHHIACLARGDLRQRARGRFICDLGAPLPLRRKNMNRALAEIILRDTDKSYISNVITPEFHMITLHHFVLETN